MCVYIDICLLVLCVGEFNGHRWIPLTEPVTWSFDVFVDLAWPNDWAKNWDGGDLRRHHAHFDVTVMFCGMRPYPISNDDWLSSRLPRNTIQCISYHDKMVFINKLALENIIFIMSAILFRTQYVKRVQIPGFPGLWDICSNILSDIVSVLLHFWLHYFFLFSQQSVNTIMHTWSKW